MTGTAWICLVVVGGILGFRIGPSPLGAIAVALAFGAFWVMLWSRRPKSSASRWYKGPYWVGVSMALFFNYFMATVGVLGVGFATAPSEPRSRVRLTPTLVAYTFSRGGANLDFSGYEVQVRRTIPVIGLFEHISVTRGYLRTTADPMTPPTVTLSRREGPIEILVRLGDWAGDLSAFPDTIRLD